MSFQVRASKVTKVAASQTDSSIESGETITIFGVHVSNNNAAAAQVVVEQSDGSTGIMDIDVQANASHTVELIWLADNGVTVTTPAGVTCTVFHSQGSA